MPAIPVLVIEDRPEIRQALVILLEHAGYLPRGASTCAEARELVRELDFNAILLDLKLPDGSGLAFCGELRALAPRAPVVIITGDSTTVTEDEARAQGAVGLLNKPFGYAQLEAVLRRVLDQDHGGQRAAAEREEPRGRME